MTPSYLAAVEPNRDNLSAETSANSSQKINGTIIPTG